ncbi:MAG: glycosyltransferase family 2 protein [Treponema sp.]|jgi:glycosyltransferase involved in cell wall biosynthesis|nr:glycosyltransferase family 2 protein [Treponema sp.]
MMKPGYLIPVYNHGATAGAVVEGLLARRDLPLILVDDGSDHETKRRLAEIIAAHPQAVLVTLEKNSGKGAAIAAGVNCARELGLSHVLQVDADGQHDLERADFFLDQAARYPEALICGTPVFDESAPASRKNGRKVANVWARIVTLSPDISDALCGFRVYPVDPLWRLFRSHSLDWRMGFDAEVLVRLFWQGIPFLFFPVRVIYPPGGISHFHVIRDNARISWVYCRLFFGMLLRFPVLLARRFRRGRSA